jgi:putative resolvase
MIERAFTGWVRLTEWARSFGMHPQTGYRWFREIGCRCPLAVCPLGTIVVEVAVGDVSGRIVV